MDYDGRFIMLSKKCVIRHKKAWIISKKNMKGTRCTNSSQPPQETLMQIARVLGVTADALLRLEELPAISEQ